MIRNATIAIAVLLVAALATYMLDFAPTQSPNIAALTQEETRDCPDQNPAPDFAYKDIDGQDAKLSDHRSKIVILNFWASWCAPCIKEFPHFLKAAESYPDDVIFIGASSDFNREAMMRFIDKMRDSHENTFAQDNVVIFHDENQEITLDLFQTLRLPETILIDRQGHMNKKIIGAEWAYDDLRQDIENIMNYSDKSCKK